MSPLPMYESRACCQETGCPCPMAPSNPFLLFPLSPFQCPLLLRPHPVVPICEVNVCMYLWARGDAQGKRPQMGGVNGVPQDLRGSYSHWKPMGGLSPGLGGQNLPFSSGLRSPHASRASPRLFWSQFPSCTGRGWTRNCLRARSAWTGRRAPSSPDGVWAGDMWSSLHPRRLGGRPGPSAGTHLAIYHHPQPWQRIASPRAGPRARRGRSPRPAGSAGGRPAAGLMARPPVPAGPGAPQPPPPAPSPPAPLPLSAPRCAAGRSGPAARFRPGSRAPAGWAGTAAAPPRPARRRCEGRAPPRELRGALLGGGVARSGLPPAGGGGWTLPGPPDLASTVACTRGWWGPRTARAPEPRFTAAHRGPRARRVPRVSRPAVCSLPRAPAGTSCRPKPKRVRALGRWAGLGWRPGDAGVAEYTELSCPGPHV